MSKSSLLPEPNPSALLTEGLAMDWKFRVYKLYGPKPYTDKVLNILKFLKDQGLL